MEPDVQGGAVSVGERRLPLCPFPPISWWAAAQSEGVLLDAGEHYQKRSFRNRFAIMTSGGAQVCTIPVERRGGRPRPQDETSRIGGDADRKVWQAIRTAYGRTPFFDEMSEGLAPLILEGAASLGEWNRATIRWAASWLDLDVPPDAQEVPTRVDHTGNMARFAAQAGRLDIRWPHVWSGRHDAIPFLQLGILDVLLHLGPEARRLITPIPWSAPQRPG